MMSVMRGSVLTMALLMGPLIQGHGTAEAQALSGRGNLWLSCDNGGNYQIRPVAVSEEGDLVTAQLILRGGRGARVRLIPSGEGYRYAGPNVWFDGWRENVYLYLSKNRPIACTVVGGPERAKG